jgi:hypothetical protein
LADIDDRELLNRIHAGAAIGRKVAALRPPRLVLGQQLRNYTDLLSLAVQYAVIEGTIATVKTRN